MRRFLRQILLFSLPFLVGLVWLFTGPYAKSYAYNQITKDCRTGNWMYRRLYESPHPVDIAFVGTSKTMCDVNDALLQERLEKEHGIQSEIANFGVCRTGENLHYLIAREVLAQKPPKHLFVEVSTHLATNSHFHFPYLAETRDILTPPFHQAYFSDLGDFTWNRLLYQRENLLGIERTYNDYLRDPQHSFMVVANDIVADSAQMARVAQKRAKTLTPETLTGVPAMVHDVQAFAAYRYYQRIADLCAAQGTQLHFLYLPSYGVPISQPRELNFYQEMGPVFIPPDSIFHNPKIHMDDSHLNQAGAAKLADWLVLTVKSVLAP